MKRYLFTLADALTMRAKKLQSSVIRRYIKGLLAAEYGLVCQLCHHPIVSLAVATIDHIIPRGAGGPDVVANWQLTHARCNSVKDNMMPDEWAIYGKLLIEGAVILNSLEELGDQSLAEDAGFVIERGRVGAAGSF